MGIPDNEIDLNVLHQNIIDQISAQFPDFQTVADYSDKRTKLPLPACLVELVDFEPADDADVGTEQLVVNARFEARLVMGFRTPQISREVRKVGAALMAFIHKQRWGLPVMPAVIVSGAADAFAPEFDQYEIWRIEFDHILALGESVWNNDGVVPTKILYSYVPQIGIPFEPVYQELGKETVPEYNPPIYRSFTDDFDEAFR